MVEEVDCSCTSARILIVDDELFNLMALRALLKSLGFACDSASDGQEVYLNPLSEALNRWKERAL